MGPDLNIFAIYTLEDSAVMQRVVKSLKSSEKDEAFSIWNDDPILPEQVWKPKIESRLGLTDIFILFVSDAFMHSHFIQQLEFKMVIDRYKEGKSKVIPIIIDKCPWDIDFRSDDYNFNLNELGVLPDAGKPIKEWDSSEEVYDAIAKNIKGVINPDSSNDVLAESKEEAVGMEEERIEENPTIAEAEEQMAIPFDAEKEKEEEKRQKAEIEAKRIAEEKRAKENAEAKQRIAEEQRRQQEATAERKLEEERKKEAAAESRKLEEQKRLKEEAESKRKAEEAQRVKEGSRQEFVATPREANKEVSEENASGSRKKMLLGVLIGLIAFVSIWMLSKGTDDKVVEPPVNTEAVEVEESIPVEEADTAPVAEEESLPVLAVGDQYQGGLIFALDADGRSGKIVHIDDAGPMPWLDAIIIHDKLGKGWRLPTLDELRVLYKTLGQGASNTAEFADKLYWSATPYDEYQARLLQFRTGNTSYHYNKQAEHRQFLVRAVKDFNR